MRRHLLGCSKNNENTWTIHRLLDQKQLNYAQKKLVARGNSGVPFLLTLLLEILVTAVHDMSMTVLVCL